MRQTGSGSCGRIKPCSVNETGWFRLVKSPAAWPGRRRSSAKPLSPQALGHFTLSDQVDQLVGASETDPDLGFMARLMALCSLPRTNPGNRWQYIRQNGPYKLIMISGGNTKLPCGNLPRLLMAWVCTEAVHTQSRELVLGKLRSPGSFLDMAGRNPKITMAEIANMEKKPDLSED